MSQTPREAHGMSVRAWAVYTDPRARSADAVACVIRIAAAEALRELAAEATSLGAERAKHYLNADVLLARADYLDPEGATR